MFLLVPTHPLRVCIKADISNGSCCLSALALLVGCQEGHPACKKTQWWGTDMVICLERGAGLHVAQQMPLPLTISCSSKYRLVLPFWYWLTRVLPDKGPLNGCSCFVVVVVIVVQCFDTVGWASGRASGL